jgi:serine/threonine protein kinase
VTSFEVTAKRILAAKSSADIFTSNAAQEFRAAAQVVHPDKNPDDIDLATRAFKRLNELYQQIIAPLSITFKGTTYPLRKITDGEVAAIYATNENCILKVGRSPSVSDMLRTEAETLKKLDSPFIPTLKQSFLYKEDSTGVNRQINVLQFGSSDTLLYDLEAVHKLLPSVNPKDIAWIFRRLLAALADTAEQSIVHGAVIPTHILIDPQHHGVILIGWSHAVETLQPLKVVSTAYKSWYPAFIFDKKEVRNGLDISLAAACMEYLQPNAPQWMKAFFQACKLDTQRAISPRLILDDFDWLLEKHWGPRTFHKMELAAK